MKSILLSFFGMKLGDLSKSLPNGLVGRIGPNFFFSLVV